MDDGILMEHAKQINEAASALIEMEGMKAENMQREQLGESMAYTEEDFQEVINAHELGHNARVLKSRRFHEHV